LGATESVDWKYFENTEDAVDLLRKEEYDVIGVEQVDESIPLQDFKPGKDKKYALIFGNEVSGISDQVLAMCDECVEIPQIGTKHSLNVSVSIGIVVWHFFEKTAVK
jgi:tRNA G18 (ribose-2'-O)-methylase SpoU